MSLQSKPPAQKKKTASTLKRQSTQHVAACEYALWQRGSDGVLALLPAVPMNGESEQSLQHNGGGWRLPVGESKSSLLLVQKQLSSMHEKHRKQPNGEHVN